jgi:hypothetical protein
MSEFKILIFQIKRGNQRMKRTKLLFVSLNLYAEITNRMKNAQLFKKYAVAEIIEKLEKARVITISYGIPFLTEISKKQREIWAALNLPPPGTPSY